MHYDVKPANTLVHADFAHGGAVLIDFGVAHSLAEDAGGATTRDPHVAVLAGSTPGASPTRRSQGPRWSRRKLPYASPEILLGRMPSAASDQYSLACSAVELLTGQPPFAATTADALIEAHLQQHPAADIEQDRVDTPVSRPDRRQGAGRDPRAALDTCSRFVELLALSLR